MFKFLFGKKGDVEAVKETQRQTATRALKELNTILTALPVQPKIAITPGDAVIEIDWPEQMPDEAMALPAPTQQERDAQSAETSDIAVEAPEDTAKVA